MLLCFLYSEDTPIKKKKKSLIIFILSHFPKISSRNMLILVTVTSMAQTLLASLSTTSGPLLFSTEVPSAYVNSCNASPCVRGDRSTQKAAVRYSSETNRSSSSSADECDPCVPGNQDRVPPCFPSLSTPAMFAMSLCVPCPECDAGSRVLEEEPPAHSRLCLSPACAGRGSHLSDMEAQRLCSGSRRCNQLPSLQGWKCGSVHYLWNVLWSLLARATGKDTMDRAPMCHSMWPAGPRHLPGRHLTCTKPF